MDTKKRSYKNLQIQTSKEHIKKLDIIVNLFYFTNETHNFTKLNMVKNTNILNNYELIN